jgi:hypothetical protein
MNPEYNPQQPSNLNSGSSNKTTNYFNNVFIPAYTVSDNANDSITSFFEQQTGSLESAKLLAQALINTAQAERADPLVILDQFKNIPSGELNTIMALYFNTSRVGTSLLGIRNEPKTSPYVSRTILV